jgi:tRNA pseudouridine55 synthase
MERFRPMGTPTSDVSGLLLVDKPAGLTSHDVVAIVRRIVGSQRVGHTGTLDPFATGLLVVLVGRGTRLIPYMHGEPKVYDARIRFGAETDTDDATGETIRESGIPDDAAITAAVAQLTGTVDQMPPSYSAKKVGGTRSYAAARRGTALDLKPSRVTVHRWELGSRTGADLAARITCSGGTYIRALARDLGRLTNTAAHLEGLRRVQSGSFAVGDAYTLDQLRAGDFTMLTLRAAIPSIPTRRLAEVELTRVLHGNAIVANGEPLASQVALIDDEKALVAVAEREGDELRPKLVLRDA